VRKTILSTADVARLFNVTETTVKRWADGGTLKCQKTPGGHRKFEIRSVIDFAEKNNFDPVGVLQYMGDRALSEKLQLAVLSRDYASLVRMYVERALSPDTTDLFTFLSFLYEHRIALADIYDRVLAPGMHEIGELWAAGKIGVSHEHRASYETMDALAKLQAEIHVRPPTGRRVVCACLGEELHEIGLRCAANLFESEGWKVHYLGARTPTDAIIASVRELHPDVVSVSISNPGAGPGSGRDLQAVAAAAAEVGCTVVLGGAGAYRAVSDGGVGCTILNTAAELVQLIQSFGPAALPAALPRA
jgi:methanogenic corrinoid protein MtbC1